MIPGASCPHDTIKPQWFSRVQTRCVYFYGQLQTEKRKADAIAVYRQVAKRFPTHWLGHMAQARVAVADGDFPKAAHEIRVAQPDAPEQRKTNIENLLKRVQDREDING